MTFDLKDCVVRVESLDEHIGGTGFVIAEDLVVTCAHVVEALGARPGDQVLIRFHTGGTQRSEVLADGWHPKQDVALLRFAKSGTNRLILPALGTAKGRAGHHYVALGYPEDGTVQARRPQGNISGLVPVEDWPADLLQLQGAEVDKGLSGASVLDCESDQVVGMMTSIKTLGGRRSEDPKVRYAYAVSAETIVACAPYKLELSMGVTHSPPIPHPSPPPLPEYFVSRSDIFPILKERLLNRDELQRGILPISALHGLGGAGKSTLASALAQDPAVCQRFPDGVFWVYLGQKPKILTRLIELIRGLGDSGFNSLGIYEASTRLHSLLHSRAVLMIIDDVWNSDDVQPFRVGSSRCHLLITTRRADATEPLGAKIYEVNQMSPPQAIELLSNRLFRPLKKREREEARRYAARVGYLPLALALGAVQIRKGKSWSELLTAFEAEIAQLEVLHDHRYANRRELSLLASMNLSLDTLREEDEVAWRSFVWLSLLPKGSRLTAPMAATLWDTDEETASSRLTLLYGESLLLRPMPLHIQEQEYSAYPLHDILHDMARRVFTREAPRGLGMTLVGGHNCLLSRYRSRTLDGHWHTLPEDGYIYDNLLFHLEQADRATDLLALFTTKEWMRKRYKQATGYHAYIEDLWHAQRTFECQGSFGLRESSALSYVEWRIREIYEEIPENLLKLYLALGEGLEKRAIAIAQLMPKLSQRVEYLFEAGDALIAQKRIAEA
ncbi:MAG: NB-ARC domain-containing protein, partial [Chloroflexota bacterium]|nr:NB-ARC domain-containing protein [Chloroflexota bacterium]